MFQIFPSLFNLFQSVFVQHLTKFADNCKKKNCFCNRMLKCIVNFRESYPDWFLFRTKDAQEEIKNKESNRFSVCVLCLFYIVYSFLPRDGCFLSYSYRPRVLSIKITVRRRWLISDKNPYHSSYGPDSEFNSAV